MAVDGRLDPNISKMIIYIYKIMLKREYKKVNYTIIILRSIIDIGFWANTLYTL